MLRLPPNASSLGLTVVGKHFPALSRSPEPSLEVIRSEDTRLKMAVATVLDEMVATLERSCGENWAARVRSVSFEIGPLGCGELTDRGCQTILRVEAKLGQRLP